MKKMFWNSAVIINGKVIETYSENGKLITADFTGRGEEVIENREIIQQYGFASRPRENCEIVAFRQGNKIVVIATDHEDFRIELEEGDSLQYSDVDNYILTKANGGIEIKSSSDVEVEVNGKKTLTADEYQVVADLVKLGGIAGFKKLVTESTLLPLETHVHPDPVSGVSGVSAQLIAFSTNPVYKTLNTEAT